MLRDKKISESEKNQNNVKSVQGSRLKGTVQENKNVFDKLVEFLAGKYNGMVDELLSDAAADQIGASEIGELKDPQDITKPAKSVWKQLKAVVLLLLGLKADYEAHAGRTDNPHNVLKAQVGLGNVADALQATKAEFDQHAGNSQNPHRVSKAQVGLGNVADVLQATKTEFEALAQRMATQETNYANLGTAAHKNADNTAGNVPLIGSDGKIDGGILPSIAFNDVKVFKSTSERDAWKDAREGDAAIVTGDNAYMMTSTGWVAMPHPADLVKSVAGRVGDIKLTIADIQNAVALSDIVDNLASTEPRKPLSAHMGYLLDYYQKDLLRVSTDSFDRQGQAIDMLQANKADGAGVVLRMSGDTLEYRQQIDSEWHSQPVGPQGPQGIAGNIGPQGSQGIPGRDGAQGEQGISGAQGIQGIQGIQGSKGEQGERGNSGITVPIDGFYSMHVNAMGELVVSMTDESIESPLRLDDRGNLIYTIA